MTQSMKLIGIGDNGQESLLPQYAEWIEESEVLIGGERVLSYFPNYQGEKIVVKGGLKAIVERLQAETRPTVVLASGDPLYYGIGGYLSHKMNIDVYPYVSSVQLAFSKMGEAWQDAYLTSVHGRSIKGLAQRIDGKAKVALLTDEENSPNRIAEYLLSFGMMEYRAFVAENLQGENEKAGWYELEEMVNHEFSSLNVVILKKVADGPNWTLGIDDEEFSQRKPDKGLITKKEIRVLSLYALNLQKDSIVWDVGTCTGSMAIEAAKLAPEGHVFAIEKNEPDLDNCFQNQRKFRTDVTAIHGKAPHGLETFPDPDAIFIGGTGGEMVDLIQTCCHRLKEGGRIVLNAATIENLYRANEAFAQAGFQTSIMHAQISRSKPILGMNRFVPLNPIYIITAQRKEVTNE
ncbi:bifunctional cobalt-precorrin-7 (C(5))-methyltransferase/cobalt-precorrin-6B (C(15))-methyltransferase [Domibacillus mangrovi]|uniref:Cobalamin biosynthesis protein CbiE n=1 Tax=Domibacillus mangrovi TaxID=1714354 RepID=A0A1Q5NZF3_9BACI|nr:bifunctional cobalt-precorrin-7 (C(5))-methyltransferase/cobalt-precorrin-6B (C(15))-methyltransferase [Domibacillus mangrovi]OKL35242.1 cobalamin biosynthesis protein CbiE [Domibacillus mangrovi]